MIARSNQPLRQPESPTPATTLRVVEPGEKARPRILFPMRSMSNVLVLALLSTVVVTLVLLFTLDGWHYYRTALALRGFAPGDRMLRPSGLIGRWLGITGTLLMILMQGYSLRKKSKRMAHVGTLPRWLEFHIYCGVLGPVMITFHTSFKFNGIVSVAYWSMLLVVLSGFVGRYLFVRIPKTIRGQELTYAEVEQRATELKSTLISTRLPAALLTNVDAFEARALPAKGSTPGWFGIIFGDLRLHFQIGRLRRQIRRAGVGRDLLHEAIDLIAERATLLRRLAYLKRTKKLFEMWHMFHRPVAYVMLVVVIIHVTTVVYFGYAFGGR